jgi:2-polyprenyl-6-methoxyphenol hydroxylase-like FAD-dependent oxidoreductase
MTSAGVRRGHAVVIGSGIAGLLTAQVLADTYSTVSVFERDTPSGRPEPRRGVPQGRHAHALLSRGLSAMDELLPGLRAGLEAAGLPFADAQAAVRLYNGGRLLHPGTSGLTAVAVSRATLEHAIRTRVAAHPRISINTGRSVAGLTASPIRDRITGVRLTGDDRTEAADLVVDAGGRGGRSPRWLADLGYPPVPEETVAVGMTYVTRRYAYDAELLDGLIGVIVASYPGQVYGGAVGREDRDGIVLGLQAMLGVELPDDPDGMARIADRLADPRIARVIREGRPVGGAERMRYPASVRRRYERMRRFPEGYLVVGDALCSFNPIYAQGMTVAAGQALLLRDLLEHGTGRLARRFFRQAARVIDSPWSIATLSDLRFAEIEGPRPAGTRVANAYLDRYHRAAAADPALATAFLQVAHLVEPPATLFAPRLLRKALLARRRPGGQDAGAG